MRAILFALILISSEATNASIKYCKISYTSMHHQQGVLPMTETYSLHPFYSNYFHIFLEMGEEFLSFEPYNRQRVVDDASKLGDLHFAFAECETISSANARDQWQLLKQYFSAKIPSTRYCTAPDTISTCSNGHLFTRAALTSVKLPLPKIDAAINCSAYRTCARAQ